MHGLRVFDPRDAECLLARVLEGCTDEVGLRVVQDDEAVVEGLRAPDRKFGVLGVEGLDVFGSELGFGVGFNGVAYIEAKLSDDIYIAKCDFKGSDKYNSITTQTQVKILKEKIKPPAFPF